MDWTWRGVDRKEKKDMDHRCLLLQLGSDAIS